jgi:hypothetical protein
LRIKSQLIVTLSVALLSGSSIQPSYADNSGVSLDALLSDVQKVLVKVRDTTSDDPSMPTLKDVRLELKASLQKTADGTLKLYILDTGASASGTTVQEIHLELSPPQPSDKSPVAASVAPLAEAIIDAARSVKLAASRDPPLHLKKLEATIEFTVEKEATGSAGFHILPVSFDFGGKLTSSNTQHVTLTFINND